jgi:hypothetical protein
VLVQGAKEKRVPFGWVGKVNYYPASAWTDDGACAEKDAECNVSSLCCVLEIMNIALVFSTARVLRACLKGFAVVVCVDAGLLAVFLCLCADICFEYTELSISVRSHVHAFLKGFQTLASSL